MPDAHSLIRDVADALRAPVKMSDALDARVMARVRSLPRHERLGLWSRLREPRTVTIRPIRWAVLAAALVGVIALDVGTHARSIRGGADSHAAVTRPSTTRRRVQFVIVAPTAKKVAVVGDFNGWDPTHKDYRAQHQGGGVWSVTAPVPVGHHRYAFLIDDSLWMADPTAPRASDDDYGVPNSTIVVGETNP